MQAQPTQDVIGFRQAWTVGDERALNRLLPVLYEELRRTARALKFFGGLSVEETAAALNRSTQTVLRDWSLAKAWLRHKMARRGYE